MRIEDGAIVRDQNGDSPGRYGDSAFDTGAFLLSHFRTSPGHEYFPQLNHKLFITPTGTIRHPKAIWRQNDMSEDNEKPLFMFCKEIGDFESAAFIADRCWDDLRTGNLKLITPAYVAELRDWQWLRCICLVGQVLFFWFPFYWNDGDWKNGRWPIRLSWYKSDGYLQWALNAFLAPKPFRKLIRKKTLKQKISDYYAPEGESGLWVVEKHWQLIDRFF